MPRISLFALALLAAGCASDGAAPTAAADRDCFQSTLVRGYHVLDDSHVEIRVGANDRYILTTGWNARDLNWDETIALRSSIGRICTGNGLGVDIFGGEPRRRYTVTNIERAPEPAQAS